MVRAAAAALGTLTVVRPGRGEVDVAVIRSATAWYPIVGALVGVVTVAVLWLPLPPGVVGALALAAAVALTGGLHVDGWADCCDAAFAPARGDAAATRARRLEILRDPRVGSFGVAGVVLLLLAKASALPYVLTTGVVLAAALSRWAMVGTLHLGRPARPDGLAAALAGHVRPLGASAALLGVGAVLVAASPAAAGALLRGTVVGVLAAAGTGAYLARRFGGVTGDVCGAVGEAAELGVLVGVLIPAPV